MKVFSLGFVSDLAVKAAFFPSDLVASEWGILTLFTLRFSSTMLRLVRPVKADSCLLLPSARLARYSSTSLRNSPRASSYLARSSLLLPEAPNPRVIVVVIMLRIGSGVAPETAEYAFNKEKVD